MSADIHFTNLLSKSSHQANANLLRVGDLTMLLDCGCDESYSQRNLDLLLDHVPRLDYIFLSHSSLSNVGALPYLYRHYLA